MLPWYVEICPNMDPHGREDYRGLFGDNRATQGDAEDRELIEAYEVPRTSWKTSACGSYCLL